MTARPTRAFRAGWAHATARAWQGPPSPSVTWPGRVGDQVAVDRGDPARR